MNGVDDKSRDNCMLYQLCLSFNAYVEALASMQFNNEKKKTIKRYYQCGERRKQNDHCLWYSIKTIVHL